MTRFSVSLIGTGTSTGVPEMGCYCATCISDNPRDNRTRTCTLIRTEEGKNILIDCGPDFREQALIHNISYLDAIILTHDHYDHIGGLDDLRTIAWHREIAIYAFGPILKSIKHRLHYYFGPNPYTGRPHLSLHEIDERPFEVCGLTVIPVAVQHGKSSTHGYRIGNFAYVTDIKGIAPQELQKLHGLDVLCLGALRFAKPHPTHQTIEDALEIVKQATPKQTYLVHLSHHTPPYNKLCELLPDGVAPSYDGLTLVQTDNGWQEVPVETVENKRPNTETPYTYLDCGQIEYGKALEVQEQFFAEMLQDKADKRIPRNRLLFCEHNPVFTMGKNAQESNLLVPQSYLNSHGVDLFHITRGGDITYHGPGQIVGYPLLDLEQFGLGIKSYIELVEECIIELLGLHRIQGERIPNATGVWIDAQTSQARKICAIGVHASRFVTMHGFALNVSPNLEHYRLINPCGFTDKGVTSMEAETQQPVSFELVKHQLEGIFRKHLYTLYKKHEHKEK